MAAAEARVVSRKQQMIDSAGVMVVVRVIGAPDFASIRALRADFDLQSFLAFIDRIPDFAAKVKGVGAVLGWTGRLGGENRANLRADVV